MKTKTMLGMIAYASACVSLSAYANTQTNWFGVAVSDNTITPREAITNDVAVTVDNGSIMLDNDLESAWTLTPNDKTPDRSDNLVTITTSNAVLTASAATDLPTSSEISEAQVGFAVAYDGAATNYYYYANGEWNKSGVTADPTASVTFTITLDYRSTNATFRVGETTVAEDVTFTTFTGNSLNHVAAFGNGSLTSINAEYEIAVVDVGGTKYGSVADAEAAGGNASNIKKVDDTGAVINKTIADNGLSVAVCTALGLDINSSTANIAVAPLGTDEDTTKITLAVNVDDAPEAGAVQYKVEGGPEPKYYDAASVKIPLTAGTYTITPVLK